MANWRETREDDLLDKESEGILADLEMQYPRTEEKKIGVASGGENKMAGGVRCAPVGEKWGTRGGVVKERAF